MCSYICVCTLYILQSTYLSGHSVRQGVQGRKWRKRLRSDPPSWTCSRHIVFFRLWGLDALFSTGSYYQTSRQIIQTSGCSDIHKISSNFLKTSPENSRSLLYQCEQLTYVFNVSTFNSKIIFRRNLEIAYAHRHHSFFSHWNFCVLLEIKHLE